MKEFAIIKRFLSFSEFIDPDIILNIGDDAALVNIPARQALALCMDTLVANVHFPERTPPFDIAYKAVAVNLSDLAAMGAEPKWITLALTLPRADADWLASFSAGLKAVCRQYRIQLIGGDTTQGPLTVTVQAHGLVPEHKALKRSGARPGDKIYVTGHLGEAALGLKVIQENFPVADADRNPLTAALNHPQACVAQGMALRDVASACVDISDGLLADLSHILDASAAGAKIYQEKIPVAPILRRYLPPDDALGLAVSGGDDYQLCFTVPEKKIIELEQRAKFFSGGLSCIGEIIAEPRLYFLNAQGQNASLAQKGYEHFSSR